MTATDGLPTLHTPDDLAAYLGLESTRHISRSVTKEGWPHLVVARQIRFTDEHVKAILALHERGTTTPDAPSFAGQRTRGGTR